MYIQVASSKKLLARIFPLCNALKDTPLLLAVFKLNIISSNKGHGSSLFERGTSEFPLYPRYFLDAFKLATV